MVAVERALFVEVYSAIHFWMIDYNCADVRSVVDACSQNYGQRRPVNFHAIENILNVAFS